MYFKCVITQTDQSFAPLGIVLVSLVSVIGLVLIGLITLSEKIALRIHADGCAQDYTCALSSTVCIVNSNKGKITQF